MVIGSVVKNWRGQVGILTGFSVERFSSSVDSRGDVYPLVQEGRLLKSGKFKAYSCPDAEWHGPLTVITTA